jgi:nucleotide-binding universal stress UspA family protein
LSSFKNILVPVDFSLNTKVAIYKTLELVDQNSHIHLLHRTNRNRLAEDEKKLKHWKETITDHNPLISVHAWIDQSVSVQTSIKTKAKEIAADLIVIGQTSTHYMLPFLKTVLPMQLASSTAIPVLTVKPGALHNRSKTVIVPVSDEISEIKMNALELLCKKTRLDIHLITFVNDKHILPEMAASALLKMYQGLKTKLNCPVKYAVLQGSNKARSILQYAEKNNADILLVSPKKETQLRWLNGHIADVLPAHSKVQVLAVQPSVN